MRFASAEVIAVTAATVCAASVDTPAAPNIVAEILVDAEIAKMLPTT